MASVAVRSTREDPWGKEMDQGASVRAALALYEKAQAQAWLQALVEEGLARAFRTHPEVARRIEAVEADVLARKITPAAAARALLRAFLGDGAASG